MSIDVNEILKALDNPTRLAILGWLKDPRRNFPEQEVDPELVGVCEYHSRACWPVPIDSISVSSFVAAFTASYIATYWPMDLLQAP